MAQIEEKTTKINPTKITLPEYYRKRLSRYCRSKSRRPATVIKDITTSAMRGELVFKDSGNSFFGNYFEEATK